MRRAKSTWREEQLSRLGPGYYSEEVLMKRLFVGSGALSMRDVLVSLILMVSFPTFTREDWKYTRLIVMRVMKVSRGRESSWNGLGQGDVRAS